MADEFNRRVIADELFDEVNKNRKEAKEDWKSREALQRYHQARMTEFLECLKRKGRVPTIYINAALRQRAFGHQTRSFAKQAVCG